MAGTLGAIQPFRYRGYVYDEETGLYYLRSRYYNAELDRFINSDNLLTKNMFSYCSSNAVNYRDDNGYIEDYTDYINETIKTAENEFKQHMLNPPFTANANTYLWNLEKLNWFANQVNKDAPWDVKNPESWKQQFSGLPVPSKDEKFIFRGCKITSEDLGNILYGYFGTAMGIEDITLYAAGGVAKKKGYVSLETIDDLFEVLDLFLRNYFDSKNYYGDDENDHYMIERGINMYLEDLTK